MKNNDMVRASMVNVTPAIAKEWLDKNLALTEEGGLRNRKIRDRVVQRYCDIMDRKEWNEYNGETIKFDTDGNLIDGQHRLNALVKHGRNLWFLVVVNCRSDAFTSIDEGIKRGGSDMLHSQGDKNCNVASAALSLVSRYKDGTLNAGGSASTITNTQMFAIAMQEKNEGIDDSVRVAFENRAPKGFLAPAIVTFVHFMASKNGNRVRADEFVSVLCSQGSAHGDQPVRLLSKRLVENLASTRKAHRIMIAAWCVQAWNAFYAGKTITSSGLRWKMRATRGNDGTTITPAQSFPTFANL